MNCGPRLAMNCGPSATYCSCYVQIAVNVMILHSTRATLFCGLLGFGPIRDVVVIRPDLIGHFFSFSATSILNLDNICRKLVDQERDY